MHLEHGALIVHDYDEAIRFFVDVLGFELVEDSPSETTDGRPKRWVVVRPPGAGTGLLLARADGAEQEAMVGRQWAGRVGLFLRVDDFDEAHRRMVDAGVTFVRPVRDEPYGKVTVFLDVAGNRWDLLGPAPDWDPARETSGPIVVRRERPGDEAAARAIQAAAFASPVDGTGEEPPEQPAEPVEAGLLDALRRCDGWLPELSWVAEIDGAVVGHAVATRGDVGDVPAVGLGPIGVDPELQRGGVGSALMRAMIGAADALGEPLIALLGDPDYYRRFGFRPSTDLGIEPPDPAWGRHFQALALDAWDPGIVGRFRYAAPFDELD